MPIDNKINIHYLLGVPSISNWPIFIVFKKNMPQLRIWNVFYYVPLNREESTPFVKLPEIHTLVEIYFAYHLCHSNKLTTSINL